MNFLKHSIFNRSIRDEEPIGEPVNANQILAVWGSPGCGKTTTAVKLAAYLATQKRDVALLLCDMNTPMLPCICPPGIWRKSILWEASCLLPTYRNPWYSITASPIKGTAI